MRRYWTDGTAITLGVVTSALVAVSSVWYLVVNGDLLTAYRDVTTLPRASLYRHLMFYTWWELGSIQNLQDIARFYIYLPSIAFPAAVTTRIIRATFYLALTFVPFVSFYSLLRIYVGKAVKEAFAIAIVIALTYSINPYTIQLLSPPHTYAVSIAFLPAFVVGTVLFLEDPTPALGVILAFTTSVIVTAIVRYAVVLLVVAGVILLVLHGIHRYPSRKLLSRLGAGALVACLAALVNAYWLVPTMGTMGSATLTPTYALTFDTVHAASQSYDYASVFTTTASWWPTLPVRPLGPESLWRFALFVVPLVSISSLLAWTSYDAEEKGLVLAGATLLLVGVQLWLGTGSLFPGAYEWLLFSTPSFLGWMFRVPGYFGILVVLGMALSVIGLLSATARFSRWNVGRVHVSPLTVLLVLLLVSTAAVGWQRFTGDLDGVLDEGYDQDTPRHYEELDYRRALVVGSPSGFVPTYTGKPYLTVRNDIDRYLQHLLSVDGPGVCWYMRAVGVDALITELRTSIPCLEFTGTHEGVHTYILEGRVERFSAFDGGVFTRRPVRYISSIGVETTLVPLVEDHRRSNTLIDPEPNATIEGTRLYPYEWTTRRDPSGHWSRAFTSDPLHGGWHPLLDERGIENWGTDYGRGVVVAASSIRLMGEREATDANLLVGFPDDRSFRSWTNEHEASTNLSARNDSLRIDVETSDPGWKVVRSPPIQIGGVTPLEFHLSLRGKNAHSVHLKVSEYHENGTRLTTERISGGGDGTFRDRVRAPYVPRHPNASYVRLEVWQGHDTPKPLPNRVWIDDVRVYDVSRFAEPVSMDVPFEVDRRGDYRVLVRHFENPRGGQIEASVDGRPVPVDTRSRVNGFEWADLGTFDLGAGTHEITLTNVDGFNAVNQFLVVEAAAYREQRRTWQRGLADETLVHHFEAEADLRRTDAPVRNASDGTIRTNTLEPVVRWGFDSDWGVDAWQNETWTSEAFRIDADDGRLVANVTDATWGWKVLTSPPVEVDPRGRYHLRMAVEGRRVHAAHLKVVEYDNESNKLDTRWLGDVGDGTFTSTVRADYRPTNASVERVRFEIWQGHETPKPLPNVLRVDEVVLSERTTRNVESTSVSNSELVELRNGGRAHGTVEVRRNDSYRLAVRGVGNLTVRIDNRTFRVRSEEVGLTYLGTVRLTTGEHDLVVTSKSGGYLDAAWLYTADDETVGEVLAGEGRNATVESVRKVDPTRYEVRVNASGPYLLSFAEGYDPLWVAEVETENGTRRYGAERLYGTTNGFWIDQQGEHTVTVRYQPQRWFHTGALVSGPSIVACLGYLVYDWRRRREDVWTRWIERPVARWRRRAETLARSLLPRRFQ